MCAHGWQGGGGLYIIGTAMLINTNVYDNRADTVCLPSELSLAFHPAPQWRLTFLPGWQGGGLYIVGTATLTYTNVYENQAGQVCSPFKLSSSAPMELHLALAARRALASLSDPMQRLQWFVIAF